MALGIVKEEIDCGNLRKCGEITTCISLGKKETYLNCEFCDYTYLQLDNFIHHIYEEHLCEKMELMCYQESTEEVNLKPENEWEAMKTGEQSGRFVERSDKEQTPLRDFEKVEIELDTREINHLLNTEETAQEEILSTQSPQSFETTEVVPLLDEMKESNTDSGKDWNTPFGRNRKEEKKARKNFILELIDVYRSLPALWDINSKSYQDNELKSEQYEILLKKYKEKYPKSTLNVVKQKIRGLRSNYKREVKLSASTGISTLYYYDAMSFLNGISPRSDTHKYIHTLEEVSQTSKCGEFDDYEVFGEICEAGKYLETTHNEQHTPGKKCDLDDLQQTCDANEVGLSSDEISESNSGFEFYCDKSFSKNKEDERQAKKQFILDFIEVYRSLPALWNTNSKSYQDDVLKNEQYEILLRKYKEKHPNATLGSVKQKISSLRSNYRRELKLSASSGISTLYYYNAMNFLNDITSHSEIPKNIHTLDEALEEYDASSPDEIYNCGSELETADDEEDMDRRRSKGRINEKKEISSNKKFVLEFIAIYQSLTALWDRKCADYHNIVLKNKQYKTLIAKYKEKYPEADKDTVKVKIKSLRACFLKASRQRGPKHLYYYDAMTFLLPNNRRSESQNKTDEIEGKLESSLDTLTVPDSLLTDTQFIELAEIYQRYTCLWDEKEIAYRFANRRREARINLLEDFNNTSGINLMMNDLEKEIARLRKICSNEKKQKISCKRKNVTYKPTCSYYEHIAYLEVDVSPYECEVCGQIFAGVCQYKVHLSSHDGSLPFKCHICGHGFKLATNLTVHLRRHVQDYTYSCTVCNKPCATTTELKIHLRLHTGERPYVCHICGKTFSSCSELRGHAERIHEKQKLHKCEICSKRFYEKRKLKDHINAHLKVRDCVCNVCDKGFTSRKLLRQHKQIHDIEKKYECKFCGKRFSQSAGLNSHMKSHGTKLSAIPIKS